MLTGFKEKLDKFMGGANKSPSVIAANLVCDPRGPFAVLVIQNLIDGIMEKEGSVLRADGRQLKTGSSLSLGKMVAFFAVLTCLIIRNSAVAEIYSLNIINKTALAAGLQTSRWGTRKNRTTKF